MFGGGRTPTQPSEHGRASHAAGASTVSREHVARSAGASRFLGFGGMGEDQFRGGNHASVESSTHENRP
ncbi:hypothetical protein MRX96_014264 [Rhipicephalus microplus]